MKEYKISYWTNNTNAPHKMLICGSVHCEVGRRLAYQSMRREVCVLSCLLCLLVLQFE